jgi:hypothetical protein
MWNFEGANVAVSLLFGWFTRRVPDRNAVLL